MILLFENSIQKYVITNSGLAFERGCALLRLEAITLAITIKVGRTKNSSIVRMRQAIVEQNAEIFLTFTPWTKRGKQGGS